MSEPNLALHGGLVLVTGASGFVGSAMVRHLQALGQPCRAAVRRMTAAAPGLPNIESVAVGDVGADTDWVEAVTGVDVVIHAAARVHLVRDRAADPLREYREVNVAGTLGLARAAVRHGVRRFVFLSSIKVNGEETRLGCPYRPEDPPGPCDAYGVSKLEAEEGLRRIERETGLEVVIVRPVLVYGPGVRGNFRQMVKWLDRGVPLPLGSVHNLRSLVSLGNLTDLLHTVTHHPAAAGETFFVSDDHDLSTTELLERTAKAFGSRARLFPFPCAALKWAAGGFHQGATAQRLCASLQVDIQKTIQLLGWRPPVSVDDALADTARDLRLARGQ